MALRNSPAATAPATNAAAAAFEGMDDDAANQALQQAATDDQSASGTAQADQTVSPGAQAPASQPQPAGAVAVAPSRAVAAFKLRGIYDDLQNQIDADTLASMGYGAFPRLTVNQGGTLVENKKVLIGDVVDFSLQSWNFAHMVVTGAKNNKEADKLIRTSYDGVNLADGSGTVVQYVEHLKLEGYKDASVKTYVELYGLILQTTLKGKTEQVPEEDQTLYQVSVSPQSVKNWGRFLLESRMRAMKRIMDSQEISLTGEATEMNGNMFGLIQFKPKASTKQA